MYKGLFEKFGDNSLEKQVLIILGIAGLVFSILTSIMNLYLNLGLLIVTTSLGTGVCAYMVLYLALTSNDLQKASYFGLLSLTLILYPSLWLLNGGSMGPTALFMLFNAILIAVLFENKGCILMLTMQVVCFFILILVEYNNPELIQGYSSHFSRIVDYSFSFALTLLCTFVVVVGVVKVYRRNIHELEELHLELLNKNKMLKIMSETDEMTGVFNRRFIMNSVEELIDSKPLVKETAIVMIDIDYFKSINDTYGHGFGDVVIKRVCGALKDSIRITDIIGRIGGEEFLIVMPEISKEDAQVRVETFRKLISELKWNDSKLQVTISIGTYFLNGDETLDEALDQADIGLYEAKSTGRNKVVIVGV